MCLAIPLKIIQLDGNTALAEAGGVTRSIRVDFIPAPKLGEYVMVHAGFAIERLDAQQARLDLEAWKELENALL